MILAAIVLVIWLFLLWFAANYLINTSVRIAKYFNVSSLLIWLTVLAMGTSAPELFLSWMSAINWSWSLSVGNIIWSNIFNLWFILWLSALVAPILVQKNLVYRDWTFLLIITCLVLFMLWDQQVLWWEWAILLALLVGYNAFLWFKKESSNEVADVIDVPNPKKFYILFGISVALCLFSWEVVNWHYWISVWMSIYWVIFVLALIITFLLSYHSKRRWKSKEKDLWMILNTAKLLASLWILVLSSDLVVHAAVFIAQNFWVSEWAIWATIIAAWTSLPEVAATLAAIIKKKYDMWVWNVIWSDIFNILWIIGISSVITPLHLKPTCLLSSWCDIDFWTMLFRDNIFSVWVLIITLIITFIFMRTWRKLSKWEWLTLIIFATIRMAFEISPTYFMWLLGLG